MNNEGWIEHFLVQGRLVMKPVFSHEDTVSVCGVDFARRLVAVKGRQGRLTFAPPPEYRHVTGSTKEETVKEDETSGISGVSMQWMQHLLSFTDHHMCHHTFVINEVLQAKPIVVQVLILSIRECHSG